MHSTSDNLSSRSGSDRWSFVLRAVALWLVATLAGLLLSHGVSLIRGSSWANLSWHKYLLYGALLAGFASIPAVARYWRSTTPPEKTFAVGLAFLLLVGQTAGQSRGLFPFVEWSMFSHSVVAENILVVEYVGVTEEGDRIHLSPGQIFPALGFGTCRYQNGLDMLVRGGLTPAGREAQQEFRTRLESSLAAMKQQYNRQNISNPLTEIEVYLSGVHARSKIEQGPRKLAYSTSESEITAAVNESNL